MGWTERLHPDDREGFVFIYRSAVAARIAFQREHRLHRADGQYRRMLTTGVPRPERDSDFAGLALSSIDLTEVRCPHQAGE